MNIHQADKALQTVDQLTNELISLRAEVVQGLADYQQLKEETDARDYALTTRILAVLSVLDPDQTHEAVSTTQAIELLRTSVTRLARELQQVRDREAAVVKTAPWSLMLTELHLQAPEFAAEVSRRLANRLGAHCPQCWFAKGWAHGDLDVISDRDMGKDGLR